ncbi:nucleoside diphosphate kinase, putative [Eimeria maxima]|uniref:Nucleoside diphosphate kinase n=1 Tax=Eimeria maxima TaxID=5804 RepID=U6M800_EIMMA|nr:nucleoside diphosphate kinase, putative [Eimeria maxima]CDJ59193.1 nucleoside diphosphate kinase, putative [Eimeria maxima]
MANRQERTYIMLKPDGVQRGLLPEVLLRFQRKGYKLIAIKMVYPTKDLLEKHYQDLNTKPFFPSLISYMSSGPVVAMVWEGTDVVKQGRKLLGETRPLESQPGTLRGDFCIDVGRNIVHGSDSVESAKKEISLWFKDNELCEWTPANNSWIYELVVERKQQFLKYPRGIVSNRSGIVWGSWWDRTESYWERLGIVSGSFPDRARVVWERLLVSWWDRIGIVMGSYWDRYGIVLGSLWDRIGIVMGSFWDRDGIVMGSYWDRIGIEVGIEVGIVLGS